MGHPAPFTSVAEFNELSGSLLLNSLLTRFRFPFYTGTLPLTKFPDMNLTTQSLAHFLSTSTKATLSGEELVGEREQEEKTNEREGGIQCS